MISARRLLVTGAHGFVAGSVLAQADATWQVHAVSRGVAPALSQRLQWHRCEGAAERPWAQVFREVLPEAVIHTAAAADIDICQAQPELARAVNVGLTRTLVGLCGELGCRLVFCSTDTIFDGEKAPYDEDSPPGPVNIYAETKVEAERLVASLGAQAVIARLSLVVGLPVLGAGNSFLARLLAALRDGRTVAVPEREVRTPVDVVTVGRALLELAADPHQGIFHLAGHDRLNRLELARRIAVRFGFPEQLIVAQAAAAVPGRAVRPRDVSLCNAKARARLKTSLHTFDEGLSLILKTTETPAL